MNRHGKIHFEVGIFFFVHGMGVELIEETLLFGIAGVVVGGALVVGFVLDSVPSREDAIVCSSYNDESIGMFRCWWWWW